MTPDESALNLAEGMYAIEAAGLRAARAVREFEGRLRAEAEEDE